MPPASSTRHVLRSLDELLSQLLSPATLHRVLIANRRNRYALIAAIAGIAGSLAEWKRRDYNRDEAKRRIPHRRNSAVHLYDGMCPRPPQTMAKHKAPMKSLFPTRTTRHALSSIRSVQSFLMPINDCS
jgi:hypothetical protein